MQLSLFRSTIGLKLTSASKVAKQAPSCCYLRRFNNKSNHFDRKPSGNRPIEI
ncbi:MAG: hypothetical protein ACTS68_01460 [Candidatus Hodgkinia cicadicola]